jgi:hypothetical protein
MALNELRKLKVKTSELNYHCKLLIKGVEVDNKTIISLAIKESVFYVPRLDLIINDNGLFTDLVPLEDDDEITVEISKSNKQDAVITSLKFRLLDFEFQNTGGSNLSSYGLHISALYDLPIYFPLKNKSFPKKTSVDVLKELGNEYGLTVNSYITSNDIMTWLQINQKDNDFINNVLKNSYISEDDFLIAYFDRNNSMNITSILTELKQKDAFVCSYDEKKFLDKEPDLKEDTTTPKDNDLIKLYYGDIQITSVAGIINKMSGGYSYLLNWYENNGVETKATITNKQHELTQLTWKNKKNIKEITAQSNFGYLSGNVHSNWFKAMIINKTLKDMYFSFALTMPINPNDKIQLLDKGFVKVPNNVKYSVDEQNINVYNENYSGTYFIGELTHTLVFNGGGNYGMKATMFRNGLNKNGFMEDSEWSVSE